MKVTLRERKKNGKIALYLDYYNKGKRKTEYLSLYLIQNPKTKNERTVNKKTRELAETIWAQRQVEIQQGQYGFNDIEKLKNAYNVISAIHKYVLVGLNANIFIIARIKVGLPILFLKIIKDQ